MTNGINIIANVFKFVPLKKINPSINAIIVAVILLVLVFVPGIGITNYGATRWIGFGSFTIQPSECFFSTDFVFIYFLYDFPECVSAFFII